MILMMCDKYSCEYSTPEEHERICPGNVSFRPRACIRSVFPEVIHKDAFWATDAWLYHFAKRILANMGNAYVTPGGSIIEKRRGS